MSLAFFLEAVWLAMYAFVELSVLFVLVAMLVIWVREERYRVC
jgi:hypothetical protein